MPPPGRYPSTRGIRTRRVAPNPDLRLTGLAPGANRARSAAAPPPREQNFVTHFPEIRIHTVARQGGAAWARVVELTCRFTIRYHPRPARCLLGVDQDPDSVAAHAAPPAKHSPPDQYEGNEQTVSGAPTLPRTAAGESQSLPTGNSPSGTQPARDDPQRGIPARVPGAGESRSSGTSTRTVTGIGGRTPTAGERMKPDQPDPQPLRPTQSHRRAARTASGRAERHLIERRPYPNAPTLTRPTPARPPGTRATPRRRPSATGPLPATVWTTGPVSVDPEANWPESILEPIVCAFSAAGGHVALLPWPATRPEPFTAENETDGPGRSPARDPDSRLRAGRRRGRRRGRRAPSRPPAVPAADRTAHHRTPRRRGSVADGLEHTGRRAGRGADPRAWLIMTMPATAMLGHEHDLWAASSG